MIRKALRQIEKISKGAGESAEAALTGESWKAVIKSAQQASHACEGSIRQVLKVCDEAMEQVWVSYSKIIR